MSLHRFSAALAVIFLVAACDREATTDPHERPPSTATPAQSTRPKNDQRPATSEKRPANSEKRTATSGQRTATSGHLTIEGPVFLTDGKPFEWRGISAFRLAEMIAHGNEREAVAYLDWARARDISIVRVFLMAHHLFKLTPAVGIEAAPRLLELAAERGLHVELVPLIDTAEIDVAMEAHVKAAGALAATHGNALVEIANEPWHPTQSRRLHDPAFVKTLAALVPDRVPVALGSVERDDGYADADYVTWHSPRGGGEDGWHHVLEVAEGARLIARWQKPVVGDEPIGAAAERIPGRRDNEPGRFAAAGALTRLAGLGATFHYEGGLQARIPSGRELEAFTAWSSGLDLLDGMPQGGRFLDRAELPPMATVSGAREAFGRVFDRELWIVAVDPAPGVSVKSGAGWTFDVRGGGGGVRVFRGRR